MYWLTENKLFFLSTSTYWLISLAKQSQETDFNKTFSDIFESTNSIWPATEF